MWDTWQSADFVSNTCTHFPSREENNDCHINMISLRKYYWDVSNIERVWLTASIFSIFESPWTCWDMFTRHITIITCNNSCSYRSRGWMWLGISLAVSSCAVFLCLTTTRSREISLISSDTVKPLGYDVNPLLPGSLCTVVRFVAFTHHHQKQSAARICRHNYFLSKCIVPSGDDKWMCPVFSRTGRWIKTSEQKFWWNCLAELRESLT